MELAGKLILLRKQQGWTQEQAAKIIDIQQSYLSKLENGHFSPSDDVLAKICAAYKVKKEALLKSAKSLHEQQQKRTLIVISFLSLFAMTLILSGTLNLFFPQLFYTYKTTPITAVQIPHNYHLTQEYLGDKYVKKIAGIDYKFELIAQRNVPRYENRWQIALGIFNLIALFIYLLWKRYVKVRQNN